jgi:acetyl esterase/lipase
MTRLLCFAVLLTLPMLTFAQESVPLFPNGVPGGKRDLGPEKDMTTAKDGLVMGKPVIRLGNITEPSLRYFPAPESGNSGAAVVIFPGGGYSILAYDLEGTEVCTWLNSIGVNAVLVKYRVPEPPNVPRYQGPLEDARRAVTYTRAHSAEWHLDSHKVGVLGFSAGGHLSALISTDPGDASAKPDFALLIYPAYLAAGPKLEQLAPEIEVTSSTAPTFLIQTEDDPVHVENSLVYYRALKDNKVSAEMHIFAQGGHGYGLRHNPKRPVTEWPKLAESWLRSSGFIQ